MNLRMELHFLKHDVAVWLTNRSAGLFARLPAQSRHAITGWGIGMLSTQPRLARKPMLEITVDELIDTMKDVERGFPGLDVSTCTRPGVCDAGGRAEPLCSACISAVKCLRDDQEITGGEAIKKWYDLTETQRESWRREAVADAASVSA